MTDRDAGYLVVLEHDIREDDAAPTIAALKQIRGVVAVIRLDPGIAVELQIATARVRGDFMNRLYRFFEQELR